MTLPAWGYRVYEFGSGIVLEQDDVKPTYGFTLLQNHPNPFNPSTTIKFSVPQSGNVSIKVFDIRGGEIATLVDDYKQSGSYEISFNASNLSSGIYFYRMVSRNFFETKKMLLLK